ncbi:MAG: Na/Pi cotransporter family protein [Oscillospiraceae bacterium]
MDIFDVLTLLGGLAMFLFGMNLMSAALEKRAGHKMKSLLASMTSSTTRGFLLGLAITAIIQSSSATTVMVVGFVNSGIMTLRQSIGVIMGANLGTSITSWILSLTGIEGENFFIQLLKPSSFTPVLALIGIVFYMFQKNQKKKDTGMILLGFAVLMFGMETMSDSVSGLRDVPGFTRFLTVFSNPLLGVLIGTAFTAIIQSSSASVGILQALTVTGGITYATAVPVIMGQNIGTCVSAMISSAGASKNARRAAMIHLLFNVLATLILLPLYYLITTLFDFSAFTSAAATPLGIAVVHTVFKILALAILMPLTKWLEKLACILVKDTEKDEQIQLLDERLLNTPSVAIERCRTVTIAMAELSVESLLESFRQLSNYDEKMYDTIHDAEDRVDYYEDKLGTYLVKLSSQNMNSSDSAEATKLLHMISDFERISDHSVNILESAEEIHDKNLTFSSEAQLEISTMIGAVSEILQLALAAFRDNDMNSAMMVEPLEQVVDNLKDQIRKNHVIRLQSGECTIELGFILTDLLTNMERVSDHCSNVAGYMLEMAHENINMGVHEFLQQVRSGDTKEFNDYYDYYKVKYNLPEKL